MPAKAELSSKPFQSKKSKTIACSRNALYQSIARKRIANPLSSRDFLPKAAHLVDNVLPFTLEQGRNRSRLLPLFRICSCPICLAMHGTDIKFILLLDVLLQPMLELFDVSYNHN